MPEIWFPNLNIQINHLSNVAFSIFGFEVYWYGITMSLAFMVGLYVAVKNGKRFGFDPDIFTDYMIIAIITGILGGRAYYVIFSWQHYQNNLLDIFSLRDGGLALYGGVSANVVAFYFYCKHKNIEFLKFGDIAITGIPLAQAVGRLGNFFNKEAFGGYTDNLFAMRIRTDVASFIPSQLKDTIITIGGAEYIQVHPTFFYEASWNTLVAIFLFYYTKKKKFDGEVVCLYFLCYGIGRFFIESLRTDQLFIGSVPVSMALSAVYVVISSVLIIFFRNKEKNK